MLEGDHGGVVGDPACHAQCGGVGQIGHRVQARAFLGEHLGGTATRAAVHAGIDLGDERRACCFHLGEGVVLRQQVRLGGHDVGFGEFDGVLHSTFGCRVGGFTGQHRDAVVAAERDCGAVADRDPGDVSGRDDAFMLSGFCARRCYVPDRPKTSLALWCWVEFGHITVRGNRASAGGSGRIARPACCGLPPKKWAARRLVGLPVWFWC